MAQVNVMENIARLASTPGMPRAYFNWIWSTRVQKTSPAVDCVTTKIRGWASFSDYWCFHNGIGLAERRLIDRTLRECGSLHPIAIDIGGHIGLFSAELAGRGFREIHTFEPTPPTFERLERNILRSPTTRGIVKLNPMAVGAIDGFVSLTGEPESPATNHVRLESEGPGSSEFAVPITTLDSYCAEEQIKHIEFLKIDTEGFEPYVLAGARSTLQKIRVPCILLEVCPDLLQRAGTSADELYSSLELVGYTPHELQSDGRPGRRLYLDDFRQIRWADIVAHPI